MRLLLDVCSSSRALRDVLESAGNDVSSAIDVDPRAGDADLLDLAVREGRIIITEDKDFGELVFVHRLPHPAIVRFVEMRVEEQVDAMKELLDDYHDALTAGAIIVVSRGRVRVRARVDPSPGLTESD